MDRVLRRVLAQGIPNGIVIVSLGLSIGFTGFLAGLDRAVRRAPVAYRDSAHLYEVHVHGGASASQLDATGVLHALKSSGSFVDVALESWGSTPVVALGTEQRELAAAQVSSNYFDVLGVRPSRGRLFNRESDGRSERGIIISERLRRTFFATDSNLVHSWVEIDGARRRVIGAVPRLVPSVVEPDFWELTRPDSAHNLGSGVLYARLKPGVSPASAVSAATTVVALYERRIAATNEHVGPLSVSVYPTRRDRLGIPNGQTILIAVGGCILLIACANIVAVLFAQAVSRRSELALKAALGASRGALVRETFGECALLVGASGVLGWFVSMLLAATLSAKVAPVLRLDEVKVTDWPSFMLTLAISGAITALGVAIPAVRASAADPLEALNHGTIAAIRGRRRLFGWLVAVEIALALSLVTVTGAFGRLLLSAVASRSTIDTHDVYETRLNLSRGVVHERLSDSAQAAADDQMVRANAAVLAALDHAAGVASAGAASDVAVPGRTVSLDGGSNAALSSYTVMTSNYLRALGAAPRTAGLPAAVGDAVVDEVLANRLSPGRPVLGRLLQVGDGASSQRLVVRGVVGHFSLDGFAPENANGHLFVVTREVRPQSTVVVRVPGASGRTTRDLATLMHDAAPMIAFSSPERIDEVSRSFFDRQRLLLTIVGVVTGVALTLAAFGIHGLTSYAATQRRRELAIRSVVGAPASNVLRLVVREALTIVTAGTLAGTVLAYEAMRMITALVPGMTVRPPLAVLALMVAVAVIVVAGAGNSVRRVMRANPANVLRDY